MPARLLERSSSALQDMDASAVNKRASGRVRKQPEAYTSSPFSSSSKRKRGETDDVDAEGDREMPDDYESDDEEVEE
ncbi:hypothetical protein LTR73_009366, partial [Friedmanniomyces endolithicus]